MGEVIKTDLCVIGAGSGGLSVAAGAVQMGARVVLIEKGKMGGDCLNYGCVPSKSLIAAAHAAAAQRSSGAFGIAAHQPEVDWLKLRDHIRGVIAAIAPNDSVERFESLGVEVIQAEARFVAPDRVEAGGRIIQAKRFVVATGSSPGVPPIEGLKDTPFLTNETIFDLEAAPRHLIVIGGGPIGLELAQAYQRLGCKVTVLEMFQALAKDDPELTAVVKAQVIKEGLVLREGVKILSVARAQGGVDESGVTEGRAAESGVTVTIEDQGKPEVMTGSHLLIAAGRRANVEGLGLEAAGVKYSPKGIEVDRRLRSTNKRVFAIGDVAGRFQFTHIAGYHAGLVIRNALLRWPAKVNDTAVPWVTYTDPELAHVGLNEAEAKKAHGDDLKVLRWSFAENDRAQAEHQTEGLIKVITTKGGKILGASLVGPHAGEVIQPWILAISQGLKISAMAGYIAPYPTLGEVSKRAAGSFYTQSLFGPRMRAVVRFLLALPG